VLQRFAMSAAGLILAGCATFGGNLTKDTPQAEKEAAVASRASARWQALLKGDFEGAYAYLTPASRATTSYELFQGRLRKTSFRAATVDKVSCEAEVCRVAISLTYDHAVMKGIVTPIEETWLIERGQAWLVYGG
jgi:hypothetical protein